MLLKIFSRQHFEIEETVGTKRQSPFSAEFAHTVVIFRLNQKQLNILWVVLHKKNVFVPKALAAQLPWHWIILKAWNLNCLQIANCRDNRTSHEMSSLRYFPLVTKYIKIKMLILLQLWIANEGLILFYLLFVKTAFWFFWSLCSWLMFFCLLSVCLSLCHLMCVCMCVCVCMCMCVCMCVCVCVCVCVCMFAHMHMLICTKTI